MTPDQARKLVARWCLSFEPPAHIPDEQLDALAGILIAAHREGEDSMRQRCIHEAQRWIGTALMELPLSSERDPNADHR